MTYLSTAELQTQMQVKVPHFEKASTYWVRACSLTEAGPQWKERQVKKKVRQETWKRANLSAAS